MKDIYVYGITSNEVLPGQVKSQGVDLGERVMLYPYKDLVVAMSKIAHGELDEQKIEQRLQQDLEWTKRNVQAHHNVVMELTRKATTIPLRFATIFQSKENLERMLKLNYLKFKDLLFYLSGKQEVGVKVYFNYDKAKAVLSQQERAGVRGSDQAANPSMGMQWFLEKKQEQQVEEQVRQMIEQTLKQTFETLDSHATRSALSQPLPVDPLSKKGEMVLNAAFLVKCNSMDRFQSMIKSMAKNMRTTGFEVEVTGPWPPYNFVTIQGNQV